MDSFFHSSNALRDIRSLVLVQSISTNTKQSNVVCTNYKYILSATDRGAVLVQYKYDSIPQMERTIEHFSILIPYL